MQSFEASITLTRKGMGFVKPPGADPKDRSADLLIPPEHTLHALHGDIVRVEPAGMYRDPAGRMPPRAAGRVVEIVSRARETFVGTLVPSTALGTGEPESGTLILEPGYKRMHVPLEVTDPAAARPGDKVLVRMTGWPSGAELPQAVIEEVLGRAGEHDVEMRALALDQGFRSEFPPAVAAEARHLETAGREMLAVEIAASTGTSASRRRDFRAVPAMTIDPADAKDFDDALSIRKLPAGNGQQETWEVGVHIADVSFFVAPGTALDSEARERATSVYLVDRTIPMLPHILSTDLCSLNPNEDRLAVSAVFTLDEDANIKTRWFGETVIHSGKRYTYEDAQRTLDAGEGDLYDELAALHALSAKLRARRQAKGAIDFDTAEVKVQLDAKGKPVAITLKERQATNLLIEDFMLLANENVAEYLAGLTKNGGAHFQSLYRVHGEPDADRIEYLAGLLRVLGYRLERTGGTVSGAELSRLLEAVKGKPEEYLVKTATLRAMAKAVYTTENIGHYGLAFDCYTHFTSPIRRYPDLLIHRLVKSHAGGAPVTREEMAAFDALALHASEREVAAAEAERASVKMKQVEFLAPRIGEEFEAVISGVSDRGLYVEERATHADGMVKITDLGNDYYDYDEPHYRLVGRRTKKTFQLGDPIRVRLAAARPAERELDFVPA